MFDLFPPLRPIVSGFDSCTCNLSKFVVSFLKFQAQKCKSYIRVTKDFLIRLSSIKNIPQNSFLVIMGVSSIYTNIDQEEGAEACFNNKSIPSIVIKNLILIILKSNSFRFGNEHYRQITGTAMGSLMAPNSVNLFMDNFEQNLLHDYFQKTGLSPVVWFVLLKIFSSYGPVTRTHWIISFRSHRITVNPKILNSKLNSKFISPLKKFTFLM